MAKSRRSFCQERGANHSQLDRPFHQHETIEWRRSSGSSPRERWERSDEVIPRAVGAPSGRLPTGHVVIEDEPNPPVELVSVAATLERGWSSPPCPRRALRNGRRRSSTDNHGRCPCPPNRRISLSGAGRGSFPSSRCSRSRIGPAMPGRPIRSGPWSQRTVAPQVSATRWTAKTRLRRCATSDLVVAISSDGVVLQGTQHPSGGIAHDLPLLVGQLCCPVLHDPGDPWQVMDHPWRESLARRQERRLVVGEHAAAGRAPRGRRCHGAEYGPRLDVGPSRGLLKAEPTTSRPDLRVMFPARATSTPFTTVTIGPEQIAQSHIRDRRGGRAPGLR
jgi:hypothetical protein